MTGRLAEVTQRIDNIRQLRSVVRVMRGIAAARTQQSHALMEGIAAYTATVGRAVGQAMGFLPPRPQMPAGAGSTRILVLFGAEQGFAGLFSDRIFDLALAMIGGERAHNKVMVVGTRAANVAVERGLVPSWSTAMANQVGHVLEVAGRVAEALYAEVAASEVVGIDVLYSEVGAGRGIEARAMPLLPLDPAKFPVQHAAIPPLTNLSPDVLLVRLTEEYVYARLCEAAMESFAAENEARLQSMSAASRNIDEMLTDLVQREHQIRQEEITAEIVELAAGAAAQRRGGAQAAV